MKTSQVSRWLGKTPLERWLSLALSLSLGMGLTLFLLAQGGESGFGLVRVALAAPATVITVTTTIDELNSDGDCSLREAIQSANTNGAVDACPAGSGADTITIPAGMYTLTLVGAGEDANATGDFDATDAAGLTFNGAGAGVTILDANGLDRALHAVSGALTVNDVTVRNGFVTDNGGGARFGGPATVNGSTFISNTSNAIGGGVYFSGAANVSGSSFISNTSGQQSGGAHFQNTSNVTDTIFSYNTATTNNGGGARFIGTASVTGTTFSNNMAPSNGGGAYFLGVASVTGTTVISNSAGQQGGGLSFANTANVTNATISYNAAPQGGGAYFNNTANIASTTFHGNTSTSNSGGGAHFQMPATVAGATFSNNQALGGLGGGGAYFNSTANVMNTSFHDNFASTDGGGANFVDTANVTGTTFLNNLANAIGGGANIYGTANVTNTIFASNVANLSGGGAYLTGLNVNTEQFVNVLFAANRAGGSGAAVYVTHNGGNDTLTLQHTTIASPTVSSGSAVHVVAGTVNIVDTIVASYTIGLEQVGGAVNENYNLFAGVATPYVGVITSGGNSITGTAGFVDTALYKLSDTSAAIDAGTDVGVTTDFEGDPRPQGTGFDIGWDEVSPTPISGLSASNDSPTPANIAVHFTATVSAGTGVTYQWNFGDGNLGNGATVNHTYGLTGTYTAIVTATNSLNNASATTLVTITEAVTPTIYLYLPLVTRQAGSPLTPTSPISSGVVDNLAVDLSQAPRVEAWSSRRARVIGV